MASAARSPPPARVKAFVRGVARFRYVILAVSAALLVCGGTLGISLLVSVLLLLARGGLPV
jgi:hypothetical protein